MEMTQSELSVINETLDHCRNVARFIGEICARLRERGIEHDASKLREPEVSAFIEATPWLKGTTYGSDEYKRNLDLIRPAIDHHQKNNRHHPEFFDNGVCGMTLIDLVEMLADWKAATLRHADGDILKSLEHNEKRFDIGPQLASILHNTVQSMGWIGPRKGIGDV